MIQDNKQLKIRNSTADTGVDSIEVMVADENVRLTQKMIQELYSSSKSNVSEHLTNIFSDAELIEEAVIAVGFRTNSDRAITFRTWASSILKDFSIK